MTTDSLVDACYLLVAATSERLLNQAIRQREGAMAKFRDVKTLQKFVSGHASIHSHFNLDRHLIDRNCFKKNRSAALTEWSKVLA